MNGSRAWFDKDFYGVLGVSEGASEDEIKRAYKKLARQFHPDKNPDDRAAEEKMKDISEAYDVLSDPAKRQEYEQVRRLARSGYVGGQPGSQWESTVNVGDIPFDLGDLFGDLFGGRGRRPSRGADLETTARISFRDAMNGTTRAIRTEGGEIKVKIPPGIRDGARIRARGRGQAGGAGAGDLYVVVNVDADPVFGRAGDDLTVTVPVDFTDATLGATITAPTLDGDVKLKIPAGTQSGRTFRVRGRGAPRRGGSGDLLVTVHVAVPETLSDRERALIEELAALKRTAAGSSR